MARLKADYRLHDLLTEADPEAFLAAHNHEFTGLLTSAPRGADAALIQVLPNLQVISSFGVGSESNQIGCT